MSTEWKTVPVEPTEAMLKAGASLLCNPEDQNDIEWQRREWHAMLSAAPEAPATFQARVAPWMQECFGSEVSADRLERGDRLLEEVLELLQSGGFPVERVAAIRDYVWGRPAGEPVQEVGGVMVTHAAYCLAHGLDMHDAGEIELARISTPEMIAKIRAKQAAKPKGSALPVAVPEATDGAKLGSPVNWVWLPYPMEGSQVLYDVLIVGSVQRFEGDGPCYGEALGKRIGAMTTDSAARERVEREAREAFAPEAPAEAAVRVKALEWRPKVLQGFAVGREADAPCGVYRIGFSSQKQTYHWWLNTESRSRPFGSFCEAEAAAQADCEARVLPALYLSTAPEAPARTYEDGVMAAETMCRALATLLSRGGGDREANALESAANTIRSLIQGEG